MSEESNERTHQATQKRKQDAKKKGQIPRSRELSTALLIISGFCVLYATGGNIFANLQTIMKTHFSLEPHLIHNPDLIYNFFIDSLKLVAYALLPFFIIIFLTSIISPILLGGWLFNIELAFPKLERLNPIAGLKKMFSVNSIVELFKALIKLTLLIVVGVCVVDTQKYAIFSLSSENITSGIFHNFQLLLTDIIMLSLVLVFISFIDVPYQIWFHSKKLKMSTHEIREEMKESETRPEIKQRIKQIQQKILQNKMIREIPKADIIITNPTHYAVALKYDEKKSSAPKVVAKGSDWMAQQIRLIAKEHHIEIVSIPPLARAIYHSTDLYHEIPKGLYQAVAQVLAYLYQLKRFRSGYGKKPILPAKIPIPAELEFNGAHGLN